MKIGLKASVVLTLGLICLGAVKAAQPKEDSFNLTLNQVAFVDFTDNTMMVTTSYDAPTDGDPPVTRTFTICDKLSEAAKKEFATKISVAMTFKLKDVELEVRAIQHEKQFSVYCAHDLKIKVSLQDEILMAN